MIRIPKHAWHPRIKQNWDKTSHRQLWKLINQTPTQTYFNMNFMIWTCDIAAYKLGNLYPPKRINNAWGIVCDIKSNKTLHIIVVHSWHNIEEYSCWTLWSINMPLWVMQRSSFTWHLIPLSPVNKHSFSIDYCWIGMEEVNF